MPDAGSYQREHAIRLQACRDHRVSLGPEEVVFGLINRCQLRCVTCWYWAPDLNAPPDETWKQTYLDKALCLRVFDELAELKVDKVLLSGQGEPFLHPDILEIIAAARQRFRRLSVTSNGLPLNQRVADRLAALLRPEDRLNISVSAASAASYAAYHGSPESTWHKLLNHLRYLAQSGLRADFRIFQVINRVTYREIEAMLQLAAELGSSLSFKFASIPGGTEQYQLMNEDIAWMRGQLPAWQELAERLGLTVNWAEFAGQLREQHHFPIEEIGCFAGYMYSRIESDGTVYYCCRTDPVFVVGNVSETSFRDIWFHAPRMRLCRQRMREARYFPECDSCLNWGPNFLTRQELNQGGGLIPLPLSQDSL